MEHMNTDAVISVRELCVDYAVRRKTRGLRREKTIKQALDKVSFDIGRGELVGYIGPNGAGKSTTVKVLGGILTPTSGACRVLGRVPWQQRKEHVRHIGVVFGQRCQLWWDLPVIDSFDLLRDIYKIDKKTYRQTLDELISTLDAEALLGVPVRQLSLGQRMRCELIAAFLHQPELLFLDEPTIGLDAVSKLKVRRFIRKRNEETGITVLLTTHDMDDVEAVCSRVLLIGDGRVLMDGSVANLREEAGTARLLRAQLTRVPQQLLLPEGASLLSREELTVTCAFDTALAKPEAVISAFAPYGIQDISIQPPPIEEAVARLYQRLHLEEGKR